MSFSGCSLDPIPAGLMEEPCDWEVIVKPSSNSDLAHSLGYKVEGKQVKPERKLSKEPHRTNKAQESTKLCKDRNKSRKMPLPDDGSTVILPNADNVELPSAPTRKELEEMLPKIPPLPSFKPRLMKLVPFSDAVADFENFITAGPGRNVEIIRQYGGDNEQTIIISEQQVYSTDFKLHTDAACSESQSKAEECSYQRQVHSSCSSSAQPVPSMYTSDSSSSIESESDMETEQKTDASASSSVTSATQPNRQPLFTMKQSRQNPDKAKIRAPSRYQHHLRSLPQGKKSERTTRPEHTSSRTPSSKEEKDFEDDGHDYWRECYRTWQEYYSSLGSGYHYSLHHHFLAAYRMNAVYMMEMMKP